MLIPAEPTLLAYIVVGLALRQGRLTPLDRGSRRLHDAAPRGRRAKSLL